jgi:hypothetical protein
VQSDVEELAPLDVPDFLDDQIAHVGDLAS